MNDNSDQQMLLLQEVTSQYLPEVPNIFYFADLFKTEEKIQELYMESIAEWFLWQFVSSQKIMTNMVLSCSEANSYIQSILTGPDN